MLLREDDRGVLAIGQPAHAWISGQLARAWGNEQFGTVQPTEEVCLAAEQHDVGWAGRDLDPILNPDTGLPLAFTEMPLDVHLALWTEGPACLVPQSRYAALLVSMHGWRLYERRDLGRLSRAEAGTISRFLSERRDFQAQLLASLRADPAVADHAADACIERNSMLIWTWDYLSLALCLGWAPSTARSAPTHDGSIDLELTRDDASGIHHVRPWPFATAALTVACEGRRLSDRSGTQAGLAEAFAHARWETLELRLERP